jgi:hypothetical protein
MEYYLAFENNEILSFMKVWMNLNNIILGEIN